MYKKINISEKGTLLSTNTTERLKDQELMMLYIGHTDNTSKNIQPQLKPVYERTIQRTICWKLDRGKSHFFDILKAFWEKTWTY